MAITFQTIIIRIVKPERRAANSSVLYVVCGKELLQDSFLWLTFWVFTIYWFCYDFFTSIKEIYFNVPIVWFPNPLMPFSKWSLEHFPSKYLLKCLLARQFPWIFSLSMNILIRNVNRNERQFAKFVDISKVVEKDDLIRVFTNASLLSILPFAWHLFSFYNKKTPYAVVCSYGK